MLTLAWGPTAWEANARVVRGEVLVCALVRRQRDAAGFHWAVTSCPAPAALERVSGNALERARLHRLYSRERVGTASSYSIAQADAQLAAEELETLAAAGELAR